MNAQFTKGPWKYQKPFNKVTIYSANHPEGNVCFFHPDDKMADKNARLIAACPEMYEALKECASELERAYTWMIENNRMSEVVAIQRLSTIKKSQAALAAAEGE